jgi:DNA-binding NarL/FixJ family response regulator
MRTVIAEDSVLLRAGLTKLLETTGFEVVAAVHDADALLTAVEQHRPELVIADVRMPPSFTDEGIRAALVIRQQWTDVAIMVKDRVADVEVFLEALRRVAAGGTALDPEVVAQLLLRRQDRPTDRLTAREREVLSLMAEGRSNAGIAECLVVSESAVAKHINSIFTKLNLSAAEGDHRRVLAVLRFLEGTGAADRS